MKPSDTIRDMKEKISRAKGIAIDTLYVYYIGYKDSREAVPSTLILDPNTLEYYHINDINLEDVYVKEIILEDYYFYYYQFR